MDNASVVVIGAGAAGLITAHTLVQDGFKDVKVITKDKTIGGVWSEGRVYPGLNINNVRGEFQFSPLRMETQRDVNLRLTGQDLKLYLEDFADKFLRGRIRFETEVLKVRRENGSWVLEVVNLKDGVRESLAFDKVVLCTGGCSTPWVPEALSPSKAQQIGFEGLMLHSSVFAEHLDELLRSSTAESSHIVIVGGGKSAQDTAAYLANLGRKVSVVFEKTDAFLAYKIPLPDFIRRSRFLSIIAGNITLGTRLERFLHTTWFGSKIVHFLWNAIADTSYSAMSVSKDSPLRKAHSLFWSIRVNDEGVPRPNSFFNLVKEGKIRVVCPARVDGYRAGNSGDTIKLLLSNGSELEANAVILATGFTSSWENIFDAKTAEELGINRHPPSEQKDESQWPYTTLSHPPPAHSQADQWASSIYRGIVPAKNILKRDFAINGAVFTTNNGYVYEVMAHWISSYLLGDRMVLPANPAAAQKETEREARFMRLRHPDMLVWANESYSAGVKFWTWPQYADELLEDMGLRSGRSGGNWLTWPFKIIDLTEIATLGEERRARREKLARGE